MKRQRYVVSVDNATTNEKLEMLRLKIAGHFNADPSDVLVIAGGHIAITTFEVDGLDPLPKPVKEAEPKPPELTPEEVTHLPPKHKHKGS
jgi:hypothetical protein